MKWQTLLSSGCHGLPRSLGAQEADLQLSDEEPEPTDSISDRRPGDLGQEEMAEPKHLER